MRRPSMTGAIPRRMTASGARPINEAPLYSMRPRSGRTTCMMAFMVVLLPAPLTPINPTISPSSTVSDIPRRATMAP
jgi:hypothetical protein